MRRGDSSRRGGVRDTARALSVDDQILSLSPGLVADGEGQGSCLAAAAGAVTDWPAASAAALQQGLAPLLYRRLSDACPDLVPDEVLAELRGWYRTANERSTRLTASLGRLCALLAAHDIASIPFKGPTLAQDLYGDIALRGFADLDILVRADSLVRARDLFLDQGFARVNPRRDVPENVLLANEGEIAIEHADAGTLVELHWRVGWRLARLSLPSEAILEEARTIELLGRTVGAPSVRDQVLILCVHGAQHAWDKLEMMVAVVAAGGRVPPGEWPALLERARRFNNLRRVLVGLTLAYETLGMTPPSEVRLRAAADPALRGLVGEIRDVWRSGGGAVGARRRLRNITWLARTEDSAAAALAHLALRTLTPGPEDWDSLPLPPRLFGLYYLWRPVRLTGKFARPRRHG
jgi:hypothetical protein